MKNFPDSLTYLAEKIIETWERVDILEDELLQKRILLTDLRKRFEEWKPEKQEL